MKNLTLAFLIFICLPFVINASNKENIPSVNPPKFFTPDINVLIDGNAPVCSVYSLGKIRISTPKDTVICKGSVIIKSKGNTLDITYLGRKHFSSTQTIFIKSLNKYNSIEINKREYRGTITLILTHSNGFDIVNKLNIEEYLKGVLPHELGNLDRSKLEALKAQAIVARTYAIKRIKGSREKNRYFDVYSDVYDQVYRGRQDEYLLACRAIKETKGMLVTHSDTLCNCFYHSTCGGKTANINEVWPNQPATPYLVSIIDKNKAGDNYCKNSKYSSWKQKWTYKELNTIIKKYLPKIDTSIKKCGNLKSLKIKKRTSSGRVKELQIKTTTGKYIVYGDKIRWVLRRNNANHSILFSTSFTLKKEKLFGKPKQIIAIGKGWGHGVGMCQVGAIEMANRGFKFTDIIKHYYKNSKIIRWKY